MTVVQMHQTVTGHDAIGNDIEAIFKLLNAQGRRCVVFANNTLNKQVTYIEESELESVLQEEDNIILYHHSVYWEQGIEILKKAKAKIVFRYHNITPPAFFEPYNSFHTQRCEKGRKQTDTLIQEFPNAFWLCDSQYNAEDLRGVPKERIGICPPFHKIEEWRETKPDEAILNDLITRKEINLLFVGRVAPNKGHKMLLEIMKIFTTNYPDPIRLRVIGKFDDGLPGYNSLIEKTIQKYHLDDCIEFIGEINDATLLAYYLGSDFLVCTSEHEGFCVPIVEAQYLGLPILALKECAVPETIGKNQIFLEKDPKKFAAGIYTLYHNSEYMRFLIHHGFENIENRFTTAKISEIFLEEFAKGAER